MSNNPDQAPFAEPKRTSRWLLPTIMLSALAVRLIVVIFTYKDLLDADKNFEAFGWEMGWIARALATGHGFSSPYEMVFSGPTAVMSPIYPTLLALIFRIFGIYTPAAAFVTLAMNSLFSTLTCIPVYFSAKYALGAREAKVAAWLWAFYPFAIYFSACRVWEYSLTSLLFTTCFCIVQRIHKTGRPLAWIGLGALYGVALHSNASLLSTFPFLVGFAVYRSWREGQPWLRNGLLALVTLLLTMVPWGIRNYKELGVICPIRDNIWLELYCDNFGNSPQDNTSPPSAWNRPYPPNSDAELKHYLTLGEVAYLKEKHDLALDDLKHRPHYGFIVVKTLRRIVYYWTGFWSLSAKELNDQPMTPYNIFHVCLMSFFMGLGIWRLWRVSRVALAPYLLIMTFFPITYYLTHPVMDYRQPLEPAVAVMIACGGIWLFRKKEPEPAA